MNAVEIYHSLIGDKLKPMIVEYTPYFDNYQYFPYHHVFDNDFEESFIDLIFNSIIFYAFEKNEIEKDYEKHRLDDLHKAARAAYNSRVPKTEKLADGLMGELTLDCFIKTFFNDIEMLYSRVKYIERVPRKNLEKEKKGQEVKGYDGLLFSVSNGRKYMWAGQVKTGTWEYCLRAIKEDISKSILKTYFSDSMLLMADIMRAASDHTIELEKIIDDLNDLQLEYSTDETILHQKIIEYFNSNSIIIRLPCLIMAGEDDYSDEAVLLEIIKEKCSNAFKNFSFENGESLNVEVMFLVFPVRDIKDLRSRFLSIRKGEKSEQEQRYENTDKRTTLPN